MIQAVLFDLDGTLTNTLDDIAAAMNWALARNGLPTYPTDAYKLMVGNGAKTLARRAVGDREEKAAQVYQDYQHRYETHNLVHTAPYPEIPALLKTLRQVGLKLCVLSNKPDADTWHVIEHFFDPALFDHVQGQREGVPLKPDPTAALAIAREVGVAPDDFLYLGDSGVDMTCAVNAGMHPVGVLWGFRDAEELTANGAETLLAAPMELMELLQTKGTIT